MTFFPQHFLGLAGIPRRYSDYPDRITTWNLVSRFGSTIRFVGVCVFITIVVERIATKRSIIFGDFPDNALD